VLGEWCEAERERQFPSSLVIHYKFYKEGTVECALLEDQSFACLVPSLNTNYTSVVVVTVNQFIRRNKGVINKERAGAAVSLLSINLLGVISERRISP
jgi:hypothetical protein